MTTHKNLTIGLFGFGVVGEGIYKVLQNTPSLKANIKRICIKDALKSRNAPRELFTTDKNELLQDESIDVIVELIDDSDAAFDIVKEAFSNGKSVVSANKKLIAWHLDELLNLQQRNNVSFLYEAAVCGSIPIIRNLEEYYDNDLLDSFSGIVNGSTNYILTKITTDAISYSESLALAQQLGYAESNPSLDIEGKDAVNKLSIILKHAYGISVHPEGILHRGIAQLDESTFQYAKELGYVVKLVANAKCIRKNEIVATVLPTFIQKENQLYNVANEYNGVLLGSKLSDEQFLYGKGAGRYPTSSAVLSDLSAISYDYQYEYKKTLFGESYNLSNDYVLTIFMSYDTAVEIEERDFLSIEEKILDKKKNRLIGTILLKDLKKATWFKDSRISIAAFEDKSETKPSVPIALNNEVFQS